MGTLNIEKPAEEFQLAGMVSCPLIEDLPARFSLSPLRRTNRANIRLREEDIALLEEMALESGKPFQSFLSDIIHQYARNSRR